MKNLRLVKEKSQKFGMVFFAIFLITLPYLNKFEIVKEIDTKQLLGLIFGFITWLYFDLDKKLNLITGSEIAEKKYPLPEAILLGLKNKSRIINLRVIASSTSAILSNIIPNLPKEGYIENCTVIVRRLKGRGKYIKEVNDFTDTQIGRWQVLHKNGKIKNLNIVMFDYKPVSYTIIIDSNIAIHGLYRMKSSSNTGLVSDHQPFVTFRKGAGKQKIDELIEWFDDLVQEGGNEIIHAKKQEA